MYNMKSDFLKYILMIHTQCRGLEYDVYDLGDALHKIAVRVMKEMIRTSIQILTHLRKSIYLCFQYTFC